MANLRRGTGTLIATVAAVEILAGCTGDDSATPETTAQVELEEPSTTLGGAAPNNTVLAETTPPTTHEQTTNTTERPLAEISAEYKNDYRNSSEIANAREMLVDLSNQFSQFCSNQPSCLKESVVGSEVTAAAFTIDNEQTATIRLVTTPDQDKLAINEFSLSINYANGDNIYTEFGFDDEGLPTVAASTLTNGNYAILIINGESLNYLAEEPDPSIAIDDLSNPFYDLDLAEGTFNSGLRLMEGTLELIERAEQPEQLGA